MKTNYEGLCDHCDSMVHRLEEVKARQYGEELVFHRDCLPAWEAKEKEHGRPYTVVQGQ